MGIKKHLGWLVDKAAPYAKEALGAAAAYGAEKLVDAGVPSGVAEFALDTALEYIPKTDKYAKKAVGKALDFYGEYKHEHGSEDGYVRGAQPFVGLIRQPTLPSPAVADGWSSVGAPFRPLDYARYAASRGVMAESAKEAIAKHQDAKQPPVNPGPSRFRAKAKKTHSTEHAAALAKDLTSPATKTKKQANPPTARKQKKQKQKGKLSAAQEKHAKAERKLLKLIGEKASADDLKKQKQKITMAKADIKKATKKLDYL